jgi:hypothetical protein
MRGQGDEAATPLATPAEETTLSTAGVPPPPPADDHAAPPPHGPRRPMPPPDARVRATRELNAAYDELAFVTGLQKAVVAQAPARDEGPTDLEMWVKDATGLYETASTSFSQSDYRAAGELARASRSVTLGVEHAVRAGMLTAAGTTLTPPPDAASLRLPERGPRSVAAAKDRAWNRLKRVAPVVDDESKPLVDASHQLLAQSGAAAKIGADARARELAAAADAMSLAAEHVGRARHPEAMARFARPPLPPGHGAGDAAAPDEQAPAH